LSTPFIQAAHGPPWKYATDGRICVRVPTWESDFGEELKRPPAETLAWGLGDENKWMPWPKPQYVDCLDAPCPACDGVGHNPSVPCTHCENGGCGKCEYRPGYDDIICCRCNNQGDLGPKCSACGGHAHGTYPSALILRDGLIVSRKFDQLIRRELGDGIEWSGAWDAATNSKPHRNGALGRAVRFRFPGGDGLLMEFTPRLA